jgi:hypothetical protein
MSHNVERIKKDGQFDFCNSVRIVRCQQFLQNEVQFHFIHFLSPNESTLTTYLLTGRIDFLVEGVAVLLGRTSSLRNFLSMRYFSIFYFLFDLLMNSR